MRRRRRPRHKRSTSAWSSCRRVTNSYERAYGWLSAPFRQSRRRQRRGGEPGRLAEENPAAWRAVTGGELRRLEAASPDPRCQLSAVVGPKGLPRLGDSSSRSGVTAWWRSEFDLRGARRGSRSGRDRSWALLRSRARGGRFRLRRRVGGRAEPGNSVVRPGAARLNLAPREKSSPALAGCVAPASGAAQSARFVPRVEQGTDHRGEGRPRC